MVYGNIGLMGMHMWTWRKSCLRYGGWLGFLHLPWTQIWEGNIASHVRISIEIWRCSLNMLTAENGWSSCSC
jgi:hypothetical protein